MTAHNNTDLGRNKMQGNESGGLSILAANWKQQGGYEYSSAPLIYTAL